MIEWSELLQQVVGHLVIYGFAIWNLILGVWLIVRWTNKNWKRTEQQAPQILQQSILHLMYILYKKVLMVNLRYILVMVLWVKDYLIIIL